ncbi:WhiB family transcriptional regulator [Rhodococcus qingshengii]|uniref:WhiB family transcriptional regulator n=1 Tax=Rhodococcus TaxID=1827 RepID=UPI001BAEDFB7|nr:WhiB family transcriptional regulator [Rhodococcus qingshengii]MBS3694144.1 WhiB family transcriptional regulator [Rhodococcus qingshengii]
MPIAPRPRLVLPAPLNVFWDWQRHASCRYLDTDLFFACDSEGAGQRIRRERAAKQICEQCPVRLRCRTHAISSGEPFGVWGGTTELERRKLAYP